MFAFLLTSCSSKPEHFSEKEAKTELSKRYNTKINIINTETNDDNERIYTFTIKKVPQFEFQAISSFSSSAPIPMIGGGTYYLKDNVKTMLFAEYINEFLVSASDEFVYDYDDKKLYYYYKGEDYKFVAKDLITLKKFLKKKVPKEMIGYTIIAIHIDSSNAKTKSTFINANMSKNEIIEKLK